MTVEIDPPVRILVNWIKAATGLVGIGVLIGAIFWAGQTYSRIDAIEKHLGNIDNAVSKLENIQVLEVKFQELEKRQDQLQDQVRQLR